MSEHRVDRTFIFHAPTTSLDTYRGLAEQAAHYKPYGRVLMLVGSLADKCWPAVPEGGSPWHEYTSYNPTLSRLFPHPFLQPHMDMDAVRQNQAYLQAQRQVIQALGLEAWVFLVEPTYLPESFFEAHPHLRGPRVDHPRRTCREAFAMCLDRPEARQMMTWMTEQLVRAMPELAAIAFKVNDAGAGFCWAQAAYTGPNGPEHCRGRSAAQRFASLVGSLQQGGHAAGRRLTIYNTASNFWGGERAEIQAAMPPDAMILNDSPHALHLGSLIGWTYPVLGLINPVQLLRTLERSNDPNIHTVQLHFRASYDRAPETLEAIARVFEIFEHDATEPARGYFARQRRLQQLAVQWAGEQHAELVAEAFADLDDALRLARIVAKTVRPMYAGTSMRHLTRPLTIQPDRLGEDETDWWLPHVFNPSRDEALNDVADLHGSRIDLHIAAHYESPPLREAIEALRRVAEKLEQATDAPQARWLADTARSLRILAAILRSSHNHVCVQRIRDDHHHALAAAPSTHAKTRTDSGHPAIQPYFHLLRDELDNTHELIALLEGGGLACLRTADNPRHEDTFVLGPDLIEQLRRKAQVMRAHWRDAEMWLAPPMK